MFSHPDLLEEDLRSGSRLVTWLSDLLKNPKQDFLGKALSICAPDALHQMLEREFAVQNPFRQVRTLDFQSAKTQIYEADAIILLWDGVDTGDAGGVSEIANLCLHGRDVKGKKVENRFSTKGTLYQLVCPRVKNPYPLGRFPDWSSPERPAPGPYEWASRSLYQPSKTVAPSWLWRHKKEIREFFVPATLAVITVVLSYIGLLEQQAFTSWMENPNGFAHAFQDEKRTWQDLHQPKRGCVSPQLLPTDSLRLVEKVLLKRPVLRLEWNGNTGIKALKFLTLDGAQLSGAFVSTWLQVARISAVLFLLYSAGLALFLIFYRRFLRLVWIPHQTVVFGWNAKARDLALDLYQTHNLKSWKPWAKSRPLLVHPPLPESETDPYAAMGLRLLEGSGHSRHFLEAKKVHKARAVYLMDDRDGENIRSLYELDDLLKHSRDTQPIQAFLHLKQSAEMSFAASGSPHFFSSRLKVNMFNLYENTARRLLIRHPIDRFQADDSEEKAFVLIFGFSEMARHLLLTVLKSGHYRKEKSLQVLVFDPKAEEKASAFFREYPALWYDSSENPLYERPHTKTIREEIFPKDRLRFIPLPESETAFLHHPEWPLIFQPGNVCSLYFCFEDTVSTFAYVHSFLSRLSFLQQDPKTGHNQTDVQVFCYYNIEDKDEILQLEHALNQKLPHTPIVFFGSFLDECTAEALERRSLDDLPKLINLLYCLGLEKLKALEPAKRKEEAEKEWEGLDLEFKESNRQAADHMWIKLRVVGQHSNLNGISFSPEEVDLLAEIEHRRWCAVALLSGMLPMQDEDFFAQKTINQWIGLWNREKDLVNAKPVGRKMRYQKQKLHIDLVPFQSLFAGPMEWVDKTGATQAEAVDEKIKDLILIEGLGVILN